PCRCSRGRGTSAGRFGGCISSWLRRLTGRRFSNRRSRTFCDCSVHCFLQGCIFPEVIVSRPRNRRPDLEEHVRESYRQKNIIKTQRPGPSSVLGCRLISHNILRFLLDRPPAVVFASVPKACHLIRKTSCLRSQLVCQAPDSQSAVYFFAHNKSSSLSVSMRIPKLKRNP